MRSLKYLQENCHRYPLPSSSYMLWPFSWGHAELASFLQALLFPCSPELYFLPPAQQWDPSSCRPLWPCQFSIFYWIIHISMQTLWVCLKQTYTETFWLHLSLQLLPHFCCFSLQSCLHTSTWWNTLAFSGSPSLTSLCEILSLSLAVIFPVLLLSLELLFYLFCLCPCSSALNGKLPWGQILLFFAVSPTLNRSWHRLITQIFIEWIH